MSAHPRPPRPDTGVTEDGRRLQVLTTYQRRGSRLTQRLESAWARRAADWVIPPAAVDAPSFHPAEWFGREAPLVVEIGSGIGEAVARLAAARPSYDVLAFEVWKPGVASTLVELEEAAVTNVRLLMVDAVWTMEHALAPGQVAELWTFFPDPWRKKRHHKRRLVGPAFTALAASRLAPGASWRLATDWSDYAEQMRRALDVEPRLQGGPTERWADRPVTKFERRAVEEGREVTDFCYRRVS
jgi:tRNA (guanine-N7-)-methyltransferase